MLIIWLIVSQITIIFRLKTYQTPVTTLVSNTNFVFSSTAKEFFITPNNCSQDTLLIIRSIYLNERSKWEKKKMRNAQGDHNREKDQTFFKG